MAKQTEFERLAMSGLRATGIAFVILVVGWCIWAVFLAPHEQTPTLVEGQSKGGTIQSVNVVLEDGTKLRCVTWAVGSSQSISCDWANATRVGD